ncbi:MAG: L-serine ammonia-lyase [bacterium]|nr:L-serine ammonia-lyase [bacterium]
MESICEIYRIGHGPSSSHTMGPQRAAAAFKEKYPEAASFNITLFGSLAATGKGHLTDKIIMRTLSPAQTTIQWKNDDSLPLHPNGMVFQALAADGAIIGDWEVYSTGGGAIRSKEEWNSMQTPVYPITNMDDILKWTQNTGGSLWEFVQQYEPRETWTHLEKAWEVMQESIKNGLNNEGLLPGPLHLQRKAVSYQTKSLNSAGILKEIGSVSAYALAVAEENACGGKVVTAPTCGSAGVVPASLYFLQERYRFPVPRMIRALATAGLIGNLVKENASISGAEVGCQGEIGTACAMAAAGAAQLLGGTVPQIEYAAEMGIEHYLGLTCDPVEGYVQIPCIERNAAAAGRAIQCAAFAIFSDGGHRITFDEVVNTMKETGADMKTSYKETSQSGLAKNWQLSDSAAQRT